MPAHIVMPVAHQGGGLLNPAGPPYIRHNRRRRDDLAIDAIDEVSLAAEVADKTTVAVPADTDAIARLPWVDAGAGGVDYAGDLVAGYAGQLNAKQSEPRHILAGADAAGMNLHPDRAGTGVRYGYVRHYEEAARFRHLHGAHRGLTHNDMVRPTCYAENSL
jgi:hypothetical protein